MSTKLGKYYICDRCGTTSFFEKIGEVETDGGFTRSDKFKEAEGWNTIYPEAGQNLKSSKLLCPACSKKYDTLMQEFFDETHLLIKKTKGEYALWENWKLIFTNWQRHFITKTRNSETRFWQSFENLVWTALQRLLSRWIIRWSKGSII